MITNILLGGLILVCVWLIVLSFVTYNNLNHYKKLIGKTSAGDLKKALEEVLLAEDKNKKDIQKILSSIANLQKDGATHLQKLGLVRYNPFNDTGGDHSFSLCTLDGNGNGFVLTGLHTREKTRFYIKSIKDGKGNRELSTEEGRSIELAMKSTGNVDIING